MTTYFYRGSDAGYYGPEKKTKIHYSKSLEGARRGAYRMLREFVGITNVKISAMTERGWYVHDVVVEDVSGEFGKRERIIVYEIKKKGKPGYYLKSNGKTDGRVKK